MVGYLGGCHCHAVRFSVLMDDPKQDLYRCNCSLCRKKGIVMKAVADTDLEVIAGQEHLSLYQWNKQIAEHYFCALCGVLYPPPARNPSQFSVNIECLDGLEMPEASIIRLTNGLEHD